MMKTIVKLKFGLKDIDFETQSATLGALLHEISSNIRATNFKLNGKRSKEVLPNIDFFDAESGEVYPDCLVLLNGQTYDVLADGLDTKLVDGDKVEIYPIMLAGG